MNLLVENFLSISSTKPQEQSFKKKFIFFLPASPPGQGFYKMAPPTTGRDDSLHCFQIASFLLFQEESPSFGLVKIEGTQLWARDFGENSSWNYSDILVKRKLIMWINDLLRIYSVFVDVLL